MKKETNILFKGEPFTAIVKDEGHQPIQCIPFVYNEGVGILLPDGRKRSWGLLSPKNPIAAWRATEVLRHLNAIGPETFRDAYHTGLRDLGPHDLERFVLPMIHRIGAGAYERIMASPVPKAIIQEILDSQGDMFKPELSLITEEVRAGTVPWLQEFADAGVKHPDEADRIIEAENAALERFAELIRSYGSYVGLTSECAEMRFTRRILLRIVDSGGEKSYPRHVLMALAGIMGKLAMAECDVSIARLFIARLSESEASQHVADQKEMALTSAMRWIASNSERRNGANAIRLLKRAMTECVSQGQANVAA